jgi:hypothetical protein
MTLDATDASPDTDLPAPDRGTFPAGSAVALLIYGFLFTRLFVGLTAQRPWLAHVGSFCAVSGVCLALVALPRMCWQSTVQRETGALSGASMMLRALALLPITLAAVLAMRGELPHAVQWGALTGVGVLIQVSLSRAVWIALRRREFLPALVLLALMLGELAELVGPPARAAAIPGSFWPRVAEGLSPVGEVLALAGVPLAFAWSLKSSLRRAGLPLVAAFGAAPAALVVVLSTLATRYPLTVDTVARVAFGARFALWPSALVGTAPRWFLAMYSLLFSLLVAAGGVSLAAQRHDEGASIRRALAWPCILMAGFGAASPAGPMDPYRVVALALGVLLLEQSMERET